MVNARKGDIDISLITPLEPVVIKQSEPISFFWDIKPSTANRPQVSKKGGVYYDKSYESFTNEVLDWVDFNQEFVDEVSKIFSEYEVFHVKIKVYRKTKNAKLWGLYCNTRPDIDNLQKSIFDRITNHFGFDDDKIVNVQAEKIYAGEHGIALTIFGQYYGYQEIKKSYTRKQAKAKRVAKKPPKTFLTDELRKALLEQEEEVKLFEKRRKHNG